MADRHPALMDSVLALLCFDDDTGKIIAGRVTPREFDGEYRYVAIKVLDYWKRYEQAPKTHLDDLFDDIVHNSEHPKYKQYQRIFVQVRQILDSVNRDYTVSMLEQYHSYHAVQEAMYNASSLLEQRHAEAVPEVDDILRKYLSRQHVSYDPGLTLADWSAALSDLSERQDEFCTGIKELDDAHITPARGEVMIFLAPTGYGKSWWLIQLGQQAMRLGKKVLHISTELRPAPIVQRYYQMISSASKWQSVVEQGTQVQSFVAHDRDDSLKKIQTSTVHASYAMEDVRKASDEMATVARRWHIRMSNVRVKKFPMRTLTMPMLESYIDTLWHEEQWKPDLLILDYIGAMKLDPKDLRMDLGAMGQDLSGLAERYNMACATAQQVNVEGAKKIRGVIDWIHCAEARSLIHACDICVTLTVTELEQRLKTGRLFVAKARDERGRFVVLISQNFDIGQFCISSMLMDKDYFSLLQRKDEQQAQGQVASEDDAEEDTDASRDDE